MKNWIPTLAVVATVATLYIGLAGTGSAPTRMDDVQLVSLEAPTPNDGAGARDGFTACRESAFSRELRKSCFLGTFGRFEPFAVTDYR